MHNVTDEMVNAAEDVAYASMPWHGPDEMRQGVYQMIAAALAARQPAIVAAQEAAGDWQDDYAAMEAAWPNGAAPAVEPAPSDAQIEAAMHAYAEFNRAEGLPQEYFPDAMHAALRAAHSTVEPFAWYYWNHIPFLANPALAFTTDKETAQAINALPLYAQPPAPAAVQVDDAKPNLLTWQLRNQLQHLVRAGRYLEDRVIETRGAKCMDDFDHELSKAEKLLATHPQPVAAKDGGA